MINNNNSINPEIMTISLTNSLRTGNIMFDMIVSSLVCILLPLTIAYFRTIVYSGYDWISSKLFRKESQASRTIETSLFQCAPYLPSHEDVNYILQRAILSYASFITNDKWMSSIDQAKVSLNGTSIKCYTPPEDSVIKGLTAAEKKAVQMTMTVIPEIENFVQIEPGLEMMITERVLTGTSGTYNTEKKKTRMTIRCINSADSVERIDNFIGVAFAYYNQQLKNQDKDQRYFFNLKPQDSTTSSSSTSPPSGDTKTSKKMSTDLKFDKYQLTNEKTFDSLFIPGKQELLSLVNNFTNKTGKFAISGFPNKLGILLYGPPGTGKTSLIKALAQYTNRHIVSIPLKRIKTNHDLLHLMYNTHQMAVDGVDIPLNLPFSKVIFTLEDVDAASDIVRDRKKIVKEDPDPDNNSDDSDSNSPSSKKLSFFKKMMIDDETDDKLDLSGLLNAIDGILDSPGRIIIMTTNYPEKLDPALIRPGRVNMRLHLGRLMLPEAIQMIEHYGGKLTDELTDNFRSIFREDTLTPAELEEVCAESLSQDDLIEKLRKKMQLE